MPKTQLGQHWLRDEAALVAMITTANVQSTDTVLEVGPGLGTLTRFLAEACHKVVAVEFDNSLIPGLEQTFADKANVEIVLDDIRSYNPDALPNGYKLVANIPYYLTSILVKRFSTISNPPASLTLLVQKEVAERLAAQPGQLSILGVSAQLYHRVSLDIVVPANLFEPAPKVDSQIVHLERYTSQQFSVANEAIMRVVKAGFSEKRKKLINSLSGGLQLDKQAVQELVEKVGLPANARAQELNLEQWAKLTAELV